MERNFVARFWRNVWEFPTIPDGFGTDDLLWKQRESVFANFRTTKVRDDSITGVVDENVLWLEIAMNNTNTVQRCNADSLCVFQ